MESKRGGVQTETDEMGAETRRKATERQTKVPKTGRCPAPVSTAQASVMSEFSPALTPKARENYFSTAITQVHKESLDK